MSYYKIYRNLHKNCFSVLKYDKEKKGYRLYTYIDEAIISQVKTKVSESGRKRVLKEKSKNVHAFIYAKSFSPLPPGTLRLIPQAYPDELYYNPYTTEQFINKTSGEPILSCSSVMLKNCKAYIINDTALIDIVI
jgi:hypothetical protein